MNKFIIPISGLCFILHMNLSEAALNCDVNSSGLYFGSINPLSSIPITSVASINLVCSGGPVTYTINLSSGHGTMIQRLMKNNNNDLKYNLYLDNTYSTILGDDTAGSLSIKGASTAETLSTTFFIYGKLSNSGLSSLVSGDYTDNISVKIDY
jgi:spore coat protein U-like protein